LQKETESKTNKVIEPAMFEHMIALAREQDQYLELPQATYDAYKVHGDKGQYYIYKGVRVYLKGTRDDIEKYESRTVYDLVK
jgi:hypothetical protein